MMKILKNLWVFFSQSPDNWSPASHYNFLFLLSSLNLQFQSFDSWALHLRWTIRFEGLSGDGWWGGYMKVEIITEILVSSPLAWQLPHTPCKPSWCWDWRANISDSEHASKSGSLLHPSVLPAHHKHEVFIKSDSSVLHSHWSRSNHVLLWLVGSWS